MPIHIPRPAPVAVWSEARERILMTDVAFFRRLGVDELDRLRPSIASFVEEKEIIGHGGLEVDERVRLLIAAPACRLALNLPGETYSRLRCVDIYPSAFDDDGSGAHTLGVALVHRVSLAFDALEAGLRGDSGENVGYHEFAHVLDASDGISDGVPPLLVHPSLHRRWSRVMAAELARHRAAVEAAEPTLLARSAIECEAELFAYATETFFEKPTKLHEAHPDLHALLAAYYAQDPRKHERA